MAYQWSKWLHCWLEVTRLHFRSVSCSCAEVNLETSWNQGASTWGYLRFKAQKSDSCFCQYLYIWYLFAGYQGTHLGGGIIAFVTVRKPCVALSELLAAFSLLPADHANPSSVTVSVLLSRTDKALWKLMKPSVLGVEGSWAQKYATCFFLFQSLLRHTTDAWADAGSTCADQYSETLPVATSGSVDRTTKGTYTVSSYIHPIFIHILLSFASLCFCLALCHL